MAASVSSSQESICFYGGEESEAERLEKLYVPSQVAADGGSLHELSSQC